MNFLKVNTNTPFCRYRSAKARAQRRGIEWHLTFEQWWDIWEDHWIFRKTRNLHLCRTGDQGPYAAGNVRIDTRENNLKERETLAKIGREQSAKFHVEKEVHEHRKTRMLEALVASGDNRTHAAAWLGMTYRSFRYYAALYGI